MANFHLHTILARLLVLSSLIPDIECPAALSSNGLKDFCHRPQLRHGPTSFNIFDLAAEMAVNHCHAANIVDRLGGVLVSVLVQHWPARIDRCPSSQLTRWSHFPLKLKSPVIT